jgi:succinate dehydrogenase / fumarate reductase, cytochrome b subunit
VKTPEPKENYLGTRGWIWGGNYKLERYLYTLHRFTALYMILFLIYHLIVTTFYRIQDANLWDGVLLAQDNPGFKVIEYLLILSFTFHALNGLRLILLELGIIIGKPTRPIFPFRDELRKQRRLTLAIMAVVIIIAVIFLVGLIIGGG